MKFILATLLLLVVAISVNVVVAPKIRKQRAEKAVASLTLHSRNAKFDARGNVVDLYCNFVRSKADNKVHPIDAQLFRTFPKLQDLSINQCKLTSFESISQLKRLESLSVLGSEVVNLNPDLELQVSEFHVDSTFPVDQLPTMPKLDTVKIGSARAESQYQFVPDETNSLPAGYPFQDWARYPTLRKLTVLRGRCNGWEDGEKFLALESLELRGCSMFSLRGIDKIPNLRTLKLGRWVIEIDEESLASLCRCPSLERLELGPNELSPEQLQRVKTALPHCEVVH